MYDKQANNSITAESYLQKFLVVLTFRPMLMEKPGEALIKAVIIVSGCSSFLLLFS